MSYTQIAQRAFGALLVLAFVTTVAVQVRSGTVEAAHTSVVTADKPVEETLRFKLSILVHAVPAEPETAKKVGCNTGPAGMLRKGCTRFAAFDRDPLAEKPESYRLELRMHDFANANSSG